MLCRLAKDEPFALRKFPFSPLAISLRPGGGAQSARLEGRRCEASSQRLGGNSSGRTETVSMQYDLFDQSLTNILLL